LARIDIDRKPTNQGYNSRLPACAENRGDNNSQPKLSLTPQFRTTREANGSQVFDQSKLQTSFFLVEKTPKQHYRKTKQEWTGKGRTKKRKEEEDENRTLEATF
jgi:hypothetical protein